MSKRLTAFLIVLLLSGCLRGRGEPPVPTAGSAAASSTPLITPTAPGAAPQPTGTHAPTAKPTPAHTPAEIAAPTRTLGPGDPPYGLQELQTWLAQAWQNGEPSDQVRSWLEAAGWLAEGPYHVQAGDEPLEYSAWQTIDMDADGRAEWQLTLAGEVSACGFPWSSLWLVGASGVWVWQAGGEANDAGAAFIVGQADFNGDGYQDVLAFASDCPVHTQTGAFFIFSLQDGQFTDLISLDNDLYRAAEPLRSGSVPLTKANWPGPAIILTLPAYEILDVTGDGLPDLVLNGGTYNSPEAGEVRPRSETWAWDGQAVSLQGIWWQPSGQRFDALYDANLALELGDLAEAEVLYLQVLQDDTLLDGVRLAPPEANRAAARQFAAFRLEVIGMLRGSLSAAQHYRDLLQADYPDAPLTLAAIQMLEYWRASATPTVPTACRSAITLLEAFDHPTGSLAEAGYGLPGLGAEQVCPRSVLEGN